MLAANVAFLAVPGVIVAPQYPSPPSTGSNSPPANQWIKPSPAQIASSISLVFSIGSIITGLLLIRRNRNMMTKEASKAVSSNRLASGQMYRVNPLLVVLPTWDELETVPVWPRTVGHRFQSNLRSTDVVVCHFCLYISDPL
jgi:hypothetical protein